MLCLFAASSALVAGPVAGSAAWNTVRRTTIPLLADAGVASDAPILVDSADMFTNYPAVRVEGTTLKTFDIGPPAIERVQLAIKSDGRPIEANIELWHTPAYIPTKMRIYTEDGKIRPIDTIIETLKHPKTVAVFNVGSQEFPFEASVGHTGLGAAKYSLANVEPELVQGANTVRAYTFGPEVESVQVLIASHKVGERNMKCKIELTQGPNEVKQYIELYASSGYKNPHYYILHTPGTDPTTIRVINQNNLEFPFEAWVLPYNVAGAPPGPIMSPF